MPDLVFNFKISKYFNNSSTYVRLVNGHNYAFGKKCLRANTEITAFSLDRIYVNAEITTFTLGHIFVNAEISAFMNLNTSECRYICIHKVGIFVNAEISAFTNMTEVLRFGNADISAFHRAVSTTID